MKFVGLLGFLFLVACGPMRGLDVVTSQSTESVAVVPLEGTATDDGLPSALVTTWNIVSGPGAVEIAEPSKLKTTAKFRVPGKYVIRLTANDGATSKFQDVSITVQ